MSLITLILVVLAVAIALWLYVTILIPEMRKLPTPIGPILIIIVTAVIIVMFLSYAGVSFGGLRLK